MNKIYREENPILLNTKVYIPETTKRFVLRKRLYPLLDEGLKKKVTLISAPAGFGKTSLIVQWVGHHQMSAAWLSLDENDNDYLRFISYFISAIRQSFTDFGETLLKIHQSYKKPKTEYLQTLLINEISNLQSKFIFVLDDFHVIEDQDILNFVSLLIDQAPPQLCLVLSTRADPVFPLARHRARDEITEIRAHDLKFNPDEASKFFQVRFDLQLDKEDVEVLIERTEGWVSGLQMAGVSLSSHPDPSTLIRDFSSSNRYVMDYLLEEIWQHQSAEIKMFLLKTSILDYMNASLCSLLTDIEDCQKILEELERVNLFIVPLDQERHWYRYHNLFSALLQSRLKKEARELIPGLCLTASQWHNQRGEVEEALQYAIKAGDCDLAIQIILENAEDVLKLSQTSTLLRWIDSLPYDTRQSNSTINLYLAWARLMAAYPLKDIEPILERFADDEKSPELLGMAAALNALITSMKGEYSQGIRLTEEALNLLPPDSTFFQSILHDNMGVAFLMQGNNAAALTAFEEAAEISEKTGNLLIAIGALSNIGSIQFVKGNLHAAEKVFQQALQMSRDASGNYLPIASKPLISLGDIYREWNEFDKATGLLLKGKDLVKQFGEIGSILANLSLARIKEAQGEYQAADEIMEQTETLAQQFDATTMDDRLVICYRNNLWLLQGNMQRTQPWAGKIQEEFARILLKKKHAKSFQSLIDPVTSFEGLILAKILIYQGNYHEALEILETILAVERNKKRFRTIIKTMLYMAAAYDLAGQKMKANNIFQTALRQAEPECYHQTFLDEWDMVSSLLLEAQKNEPTHAYASLLLRLGQRLPEAADQKNPRAGILTKREKEILSLIEKGYSNKGIAKELFLTVNTVKGYTRRIFTKLDAQNRAHAVTRAREMGIEL